jgi:hypothetical protein
MVYKYRNLNNNTREMIKNNTLHFANPLYFNDPFDTLINFYFEGDFDLLCKKFYDFGIKDYKGFAKTLSIHNDFKEICKSNPHLINSSVTCFSENCDNILLWSHYANQHKGICLEYKTVSNDGYSCLTFDSTDIKTDHPVPMLKVNYVEKPLEKINALFTKYFVEQLNDFLSTKFKIWEYENEIRCIIPNSNFKNYPNATLAKNVLTGVIFGMKVNEEEKNEIKNLVNSFHENVIFYTMMQIPNEYKLKIIEER